MDISEFKLSLTQNTPPTGDRNLLALWYDGRGDWTKAHDIVQDDSGSEAAWIHAYLHRKEGDDWNAGYWYRRAGKEHCRASLDVEWQELVDYFLATT